jgi:hypothetical protein
MSGTDFGARGEMGGGIEVGLVMAGLVPAIPLERMAVPA